MHPNCDKIITNSVGFSTSRSERDKIGKKLMLYYSSDNMYMNNNTILFCCIVTLFFADQSQTYIFLLTIRIFADLFAKWGNQNHFGCLFSNPHTPSDLSESGHANQPTSPTSKRERKRACGCHTTKNHLKLYHKWGGGGVGVGEKRKTKLAQINPTQIVWDVNIITAKILIFFFVVATKQKNRR